MSMTSNRPRCTICQGVCKKNGTTTKGTTRWRCTVCAASFTRQRRDTTLTAHFRQFHDYAVGQLSLTAFAELHHTSRSTLYRRFETFWLIPVPHTADPYRIYDQIFIDGTYLAGGCLLVASSWDHVVAWSWAHRESTAAYEQLIGQLAPPLCVVLDGGQGAFSAIKKCWPDTLIQRCLVHAQRVVRRYTTSRPRTPAGHAIYRLARQLTGITTLEQAADWVTRLHQFGQVYHDFLNEKTLIPSHRRTGRATWEYTHPTVRKAYNCLTHLHRKSWLFTYLTPPEGALRPHQWKSTTNSLEGGINAPVKNHAHTHRGLTPEHQRTLIDWWLYQHTERPDDPLTIAKKHRFGRNQQDEIRAITTTTNPDHISGQPALYDTAIPLEYNHSVGIRKGPIH